jgi:oligoribonuclease NrnB/cAMP/cGMP phosphodiesterase (DHH superfamily)
MKILCIYHGQCADGFGAAWVVRKALGTENVEFYPGVYQEPPPNVAGRDVILMDFSYKRPVLDEMARAAHSILILDHHKTAAADLADLPPAPKWSIWQGCGIGDDPPLSIGLRVRAVFDMDRSGAGMAWDYFFPGEARPALLNHIEDRDLWRFSLDGTREIQANIFSHPYDFEVWDRLMGDDPQSLRAEGLAIERKHFKDIAELVKATQRSMVIGGVEIPVANLPYTLTSDAGHQMAMAHPSRMACCYWDTPGGRVFSLRSTDDGPDVSAVAKKYGGGGHMHAAGFRMEIGWEGDH